MYDYKNEQYEELKLLLNELFIEEINWAFAEANYIDLEGGQDD